jgi:hypothetical protein
VTRAESVKRMAREIRVAAQVKKIMREALAAARIISDEEKL